MLYLVRVESWGVTDTEDDSTTRVLEPATALQCRSLSFRPRVSFDSGTAA